MTDLFCTNGSSPPATAECTTCRGQGETAVPGTYGPTVSPEALELRECVECGGSGEAAPAREVCLTCGLVIPADLNGWAGGHNPAPLNNDPVLAGRRVCGDCNGIYVIPARLGHAVEGTFYDTDGEVLGTFWTVEPQQAGGAA